MFIKNLRRYFRGRFALRDVAVTVTVSRFVAVTAYALASAGTVLLVAVSEIARLQRTQIEALEHEKVVLARLSQACKLKPVTYMLDAATPEELLKKFNVIFSEVGAQRADLTREIITNTK